MSTFADRTRSALVVIDVQAAVMENAWQKDAVIGRISNLVSQARSAGIPVVWVQHSEPEMPIGSDGWQLVPELKPLGSELMVRKEYRSSFEGTDLEDVLAAHGVGKLIVCGAETNHCVRSTIHSALDRGYDVALVSDAHTTCDGHWLNDPSLDQRIVEEQNRYCSGYALPGRRCETAPAATAIG